MVNFNFERLESVLETILSKLEEQNARVDALEQVVNARALARPYQALQKRLDEALEQIDKRFTMIENQLEQVVMAHLRVIST